MRGASYSFRAEGILVSAMIAPPSTRAIGQIRWENSTATPTVIADDGEIEAVTVPYPFFVSGLKARFFRVQVTSQ